LFSLRIGEPTTRSVQGAVSVLAERARVPKNIAMCVCSRQGSNRIAASCSLACTLMMASDPSSETERGVDRTTRRAGQSGRVAETGRVFYLRTESSAKTKEKPPMPPCVQQIYMSRWPNVARHGYEHDATRHGLGTTLPAVPCRDTA
jgi:hypothetical protein